LAKNETEETWDVIGCGIRRITGLVRGGASKFPQELITAIRSLASPLTRSMTSERSTLSGYAVELVDTLASNMGSSFEPLLPIFFPILLGLCARTSKLLIARARACMVTIIEDTQLLRSLTYSVAALKDKSISVRLSAIEAVLACVNSFSPSELRKDSRGLEIEMAIKLSAKDANADVRKASRKVFEAYRIVLPERVPR
jgi:hypothetical protein